MAIDINFAVLARIPDGACVHGNMRGCNECNEGAGQQTVVVWRGRGSDGTYCGGRCLRVGNLPQRKE